VNDASLLLKQASKRFKNVVIGEDFASFELALPE
jgi:hypothetical protein